MSQTYNVYCDESCHLENDGLGVMVLGAIWCPTNHARTASDRLRALKAEHGLGPLFESKWVKVSPAKKDYYTGAVDVFWRDDDLHFRALVVPDKSRLRHAAFEQTHDTWYYKMYFDMLKAILNPSDCYRIYLDIKDTRSADKTRKLHEVLSNNVYDFDRRIIERVQTVRSHEVELLQLADLLVGAVAYANRGLHSNAGKTAVVHNLRRISGYSLTRTTLLKENKLNVFVWEASEVQS